MKFFRLLLSLHSLRLIVILVLAMTYLTRTVPISSNKTDGVKHEASQVASEDGNRLIADNAGPPEGKIEINTMPAE